MIWTHVIVPFFAMFVMVFFKSFQQLNVMKDNRKAVIFISLCLATSEVLLISTVVTTGFGWVCIPIGLGGSCGCLLSMSLHKKWFSNKCPSMINTTETQQYEEKDKSQMQSDGLLLSMKKTCQSLWSHLNKCFQKYVR
jgi:hypothetical protein